MSDTGAGDAELAPLLRDARLDEARALLAARVRAGPNDARARLDFADLLILHGEWDKADAQADLAGTYDPARAIGLALLRQLIRAAAWRDQCFAERRPPELVTEPDAGVAAALSMLAGTTPPDAPDVMAAVDGGTPAPLRDLDDRTAGVLEVLTGNGRYLWVPLSSVVALRPARPARLRDLVWRPAEIEVAGGLSGTVYLPALYPATAQGGSAAQRLGRETDWIEDEQGTHGIGQRCWLAGEEVLTLDGFTELAAVPS